MGLVWCIPYLLKLSSTKSIQEQNVNKMVVEESEPQLVFFTFPLTHSQLLKGLKCEPKQKAAEKGGIGARSLAHNTLRGRGTCWSSGMELGRVDKLHSLTRACTQPTQSGQCIVGAPLVLGRATGNTDTQDSPRPELGGSHHLPPYSIFCSPPRGLHPNGYFSRDSRVGVPKSRQMGLPPLWSPITLRADLGSLCGLKQSCSSHRELSNDVARPLKLSKSGRFPAFCGRESNWQFDSRSFFWP